MNNLLERLEYQIYNLRENKESYIYINHHRNQIEVALNPAPREFNNMMKESKHGLRLTMDTHTKDIIVWDASKITHYELVTKPQFKNTLGEGLVVDKTYHYWIESGIDEEMSIVIDSILDGRSIFIDRTLNDLREYIKDWYQFISKVDKSYYIRPRERDTISCPTSKMFKNVLKGEPPYDEW